ncbi:hypothetical protein HY732_01980 [Candidatus Uhrbacteria bacterium]|nr:hypothetical protein [Candidatus Uhrbacteria bacterium]
MQKQRSTATQSLSELLSDLTRRDIFDILGVGKIPDDEREEYMETMLETIMERVFARIIDSCSEEKCQQINDALSFNNREEVDTLLFSCGLPDFDTMVSEETILYKFEMHSIFREE